jgi:hypothetical protein
MTPGNAFGLAIESPEPIPGLNGCPPVAAAPHVTVTVAGPTSPTSGRELLSRRTPDGCLDAALSRDDAGRYRLFGRGFGAYDVAGDGSEIACHPPDGLEPWIWQRFVMSQALPLAATLRGIEPFHAGGVVIDGRVVAIAGRSGAGKSSLALTLAARGHGFHTDDVLAMAWAGDEIRSKAGPGAANIRDPALRQLVARGAPPFGDVLGETPDGIRALIARDGRDRPLGAVYFIDHDPAHRSVRFEPTHDPRLLLGHTFNVLVRTGERLAGQLAICSAIAEHVPLFRLLVPARTSVGRLATLVEQHARSSGLAENAP